MALVQHLLDGIEQRCALGAEPVLQCPVGAKKMSRQRAASRVGRALVQLPDQVPADAPQAHGLNGPALGQRLEPGATRSSAPAPDPAPDCASTLQASRTPPLRATRYAPPPAQSTPARARGDAARRSRGRHIPAPHAACPSPSRTHRIARWPRRTRAARSTVRVWPCAGAPCHTRVSCPGAPAPHPRVQSLNRRAAPNACVPCSSRRAHESNRRAARRAETPHSPPQQSHAPHPSQPPTAPAPEPDPREAAPPTPRHRALGSATTRTNTPSRGPPRPTPARPG